MLKGWIDWRSESPPVVSIEKLGCGVERLDTNYFDPARRRGLARADPSRDPSADNPRFQSEEAPTSALTPGHGLRGSTLRSHQENNIVFYSTIVLIRRTKNGLFRSMPGTTERSSLLSAADSVSAPEPDQSKA